MILEEFDNNKVAVINAFDIIKPIEDFPFGTCGVLDSSIDDCSIIIPNQAIRDEGTSFLDSEVWDKRSLANEANPLEKDRIAMLAWN